jgi:hypothetical protein
MKMKRLLISVAAAGTLVLGFLQAADAAPARTAAPSRVQVGRLACDVAPGVGLIVVSSKRVSCWFTRKGFRSERYTGSISKLGIDIGVTAITHIEWLVFAAARTRYTRHALAGTYVGASAEATVGVGLGANWLVGGFDRSYALQPLSVQAQAGLNYSIAFAGLTLR